MLEELKDMKKRLKELLEEKPEINEEVIEMINEIIDHYERQCKNRYKYLVGDWQGERRAKSTSTGEFVSKEKVLNYLNNI